MNGNLKDTFIQRALNQYMDRVIRAMMITLSRENKIDTSYLQKSLAFFVAKRKQGGTGSLIFAEYGRFIDMGVGRSHPLGGLAGMKIALFSKSSHGYIPGNRRKRDPVKWYSRIAYGNLSWLQGKILFGYTENTIAMLKKELEDGSTPMLYKN